MREYGVVKTTFWGDPKIAALDGDGKLMALYLLTSPHTNALGCFRAPALYIAEDMGKPPEWVRAQIAILVEAEWCEFHDVTGWVWVRNYLRHNPPANGNVTKKCWKELDLIPHEVPFLDGVRECLETVSERFEDGSKTVSKRARNTEPDPNLTYPEPKPARTRARPKGNGKGFGGPEHPMPDDWQPTDADVQYARAQGHDPPAVARIIRKMRDLSKAGNKRRDWHATFRWFCDREIENRPMKPIGKAI